MALFLLRGIHGAEYFPPDAGDNTWFYDVPITHWAADWIKQLAAENITSGCGNKKYCPDNLVTRAEMAKFLLSAKYGESYQPPDAGVNTGFNDVPITHWASDWIKQLSLENITSGCGNKNFCPENLVTRAEMAKFLVLTFNLPPIIEEPTPGPMPGENEQCNQYDDYLICASVSNSNPTQNSDVTVYGRLTMNGWALPGKQMLTTWYYKATASTCDDGSTNFNGIASCTQDIGLATVGFIVDIDVIIEGYSVTTSFTPIE